MLRFAGSRCEEMAEETRYLSPVTRERKTERERERERETAFIKVA